VTWRGVAGVYAVLGLLAAYVFLLDRREPPPSTSGPPPAERSLLGTDAGSVTAIAFRRDGASVRAVREDAGWRIAEPANAPVPPDLIAAAVGTLTAGQLSDVLLESQADLASFGLTSPAATIDVTLGPPSPERVEVLLGGRNPTRTAVYAKRADRAAVFLVGLNVLYYTELIFDAASGVVEPAAKASSDRAARVTPEVAPSP
jgi:hypothetical protein